jgi:hypothetical protein
VEVCILRQRRKHAACRCLSYKHQAATMSHFQGSAKTRMDIRFAIKSENFSATPQAGTTRRKIEFLAINNVVISLYPRRRITAMCCITAAKSRTLGFKRKIFKIFSPLLLSLSATGNTNFRNLIGNFSRSSQLVLEAGNSMFPTHRFC